jgi:hypothetical protein
LFSTAVFDRAICLWVGPRKLLGCTAVDVVMIPHLEDDHFTH